MAIARAIAKRPDVLLCDEPTGALDSATGVRVLDAIERVNATLGTTTVVITHNVDIARMAHRVLHMADGRIARSEPNPQRDAGAGAALVTALQRKALRDLRHLRGQALAIALVIAGGIATLVMSQSTYQSLEGTRAHFYDEYALADAWARQSARRIRWPRGSPRFRAWQTVQTRLVASATSSVAGFDEPVRRRCCRCRSSAVSRC